MACSSLLISLAFMFLLCYFATRVTDQNSNMATYVYQSEWYVLDSVHKKYCQLIMIRAQTNVVFHGYHLVSCTMEQFALVLFILNLLPLIRITTITMCVIFFQLVKSSLSVYFMFRRLNRMQ